MKNFRIESQEIKPFIVARKLLTSGVSILVVGLETFGSDSVPAVRIAETVRNASGIRYRHIDCMSVYGNKVEVGHTLQEVLRSWPVKHRDLWITSKSWNNVHHDVIDSCEKPFTDLQFECDKLIYQYVPTITAKKDFTRREIKFSVTVNITMHPYGWFIIQILPKGEKSNNN